MRNPSNQVSRQRGWVGLIVLLLALVIVAMLAKTVLSQYGLLSGNPDSQRMHDRSAISPAGVAPIDPTAATPMPTAPLDRARAVEGMVQQQVGERAQRGDGAIR